MKEQPKSKIDVVIIGLAFLMFACIAMICVKLAGMRVTADTPVYITIPQDMILADGQDAVTVETISRQAQALSLHNKNPDENVPFQMTNMFPGDSETHYYRVNVSYTGTVTVSFQATAREGDVELAEALEARIRLMNTDQMLYEGTIADMPQVDHVLTAGSETKTEELFYEITVGLGTDVGNEYQNLSLTADLAWWAEGADSPTEPSGPDGGDEPTVPSGPDDEDESTEPSEPGGGEPESDVSEGGSLTAPPRTGDESRVMMWLAALSVTLAAMILVLVRYPRREQILVSAGASGQVGQTKQPGHCGQAGVQKSRRRLKLGIFLVVLLILAFGITSLALAYQKAAVEGNLFQTGNVSISLNDGQPIFDEDMLFEPGMVVVKDFTLRNDSSCDVYYRLYFSDIVGEFAEVLTVTVADGENVIFQDKLAGMNGVKSEGAAGLLGEGQERTMTITFQVPEDCGNLMQGQTILFCLKADAVQAVNNPSGHFD